MLEKQIVVHIYICTYLGFPCGDARDSDSVLGWEDPLEEGMATHSSVVAWRLPWTENMVGYSPWDHKELDMTEATEQEHDIPYTHNTYMFRLSLLTLL